MFEEIASLHMVWHYHTMRDLNTTLQHDIAGLRETQQILQAANTCLNKRAADAERAVGSLGADREKLAQEREDLDNRWEVFKASNTQLKKDSEQFYGARDAWHKERDSLSQALAQSQNALVEERTSNAALERLNAARIAELEARNQALEKSLNILPAGSKRPRGAK
jgi:chromosome segregation ATPase